MGTRKYPSGCRWFDSIHACHGGGQGNLASATKDISNCLIRVPADTQALGCLFGSGEGRSAREGHSHLDGATPSVSTKQMKLNGRADPSKRFGCGFESRHLHHLTTSSTRGKVPV